MEINFIEEPKYKIITESGYSTNEIIKSISLLDNSKKFVPNETLIFFDEIQDFPEIATALKFFCMDGRFDVICSGSMLGINCNRIESNSVGYKTDYTMYSMDFEEFLWTKGYDSAADEILEHMNLLKPFSTVEMNVYHSQFLDYCILGGMPGVVRQYIEKGTFEGILLPDDYNPVFFSGVKSGNKHLLSDALLWQMVLFWMKSCHLFFHDSQCRIWLSLC